MPYKIVKNGKCFGVASPSGKKSKCTTKKKAAAQRRLLNAVEHNPNFYANVKRGVVGK